MSQQRILVVDDSPTALRMTSELLNESGFDVLTACDGEEALEVAGRDHPSLIVLDIILPRKNGFQVCRKLRSETNTEDIGIVMLSSKNQDHDRLWAERQGADGYLTKPYNDQELLSCINAVLTKVNENAAPGNNPVAEGTLVDCELPDTVSHHAVSSAE